MTSDLPRFSIRLSETAQIKMKYIAVSNVRTLNSEIRVAVNKYIEEYEKEHGEIDVTREPEEP